MINDKVTYMLLLGYLEQNHGVRVRYKDSSRLMKLIGKILFFNKGFMTDYVTTIGRTVYFPNAEAESWDVLAHEAVHALDYARRPVRFTLGYLMPQLLAVLAIGALGAFVCTWALLALVFLLALAPFPSPWRLARERRGYRMTVAADCLKWGEKTVMADDYIHWLSDIYTGSGYYFMTRDHERALQMAGTDIQYGIGLAKGGWGADPVLDEVSARLRDYVDAGLILSNSLDSGK